MRSLHVPSYLYRETVPNNHRHQIQLFYCRRLGMTLKSFLILSIVFLRRSNSLEVAAVSILYDIYTIFIAHFIKLTSIDFFRTLFIAIILYRFQTQKFWAKQRRIKM